MDYCLRITVPEIIKQFEGTESARIDALENVLRTDKKRDPQRRIRALKLLLIQCCFGSRLRKLTFTFLETLLELIFLISGESGSEQNEILR